MILDKYANTLKQMDYWISISKTGSPREFATKIGISERRLRDYIAYMQDYDAPISYCRKRKSYYYTIPGQFHIHISFEEK